MPTNKAMRSFRLTAETQKQLVMIASHLNVNQTEALELAVQDFYLRLRSGSLAPGEVQDQTEEQGTDEALARQHDQVADLFEADDTLSPGLREAVARVSRSTARRLREQDPS